MSRGGDGTSPMMWIAILLLAISSVWLSMKVEKIKNHTTDSGKTSAEECVKK